MKKISDLIVKSRYYLMGIFIALIIASIFLIPKVNVNYDMANYLDKNSETVAAIDLMEKEFGSNGTAQVMIKDISAADANNVAMQLRTIENVSTVVFFEDDEMYYKSIDQTALFRIFLVTNNYSVETHKTLTEIRTVLDNYDLSMNGAAVNSKYLNETINSDLTIIMIVAVIVVLAILLLTSSSWVDPAIFLIVAGGAILLNLGTNFIFPSISFVTKAICAVMQLALAMDYSIMLLHRFNEEKHNSTNVKKAMSSALAKTFAPVSASSLTTIAGLIALVFMRFTIGFDIGLVLAKGIVLSLLSVFLFMPGVIILFAPLIEKTKHRNIKDIIIDKIASNRAKKENHAQQGRRRLSFADFQYKSRIVVPIILVALVIAGAILNFNLQYNYDIKVSKKANDLINVEAANIEQSFGNQNSLVIIVPKDEDNIEKEKQLIAYMLGYQLEDGTNPISGGSSMVSLGVYDTYTQGELFMGLGIDMTLLQMAYVELGLDDTEKISLYQLFMVASAAQIELPPALAQEAQKMALALEMYESKDGTYSRIIFNLDTASDDAFVVLNDLKDNIGNYFGEYYIVAESMVLLDIKELFTVDSTVINIISALAILFVIMLVFRSLSIPVLLTILIQGAIWITMGFSVLAGSSVFFLCYLLVMCIQMGATIDYAILLTSRYAEYRKTFGKKQSIVKAVDSSIITILTSGSILLIAAFLVGLISRASIISSLGFLLARGVLISLLIIIFALPQVLLLCDKLLEKLTYKTKFHNDQIGPKTSKTKKIKKLKKNTPIRSEVDIDNTESDTKIVISHD